MSGQCPARPTYQAARTTRTTCPQCDGMVDVLSPVGDQGASFLLCIEPQCGLILEIGVGIVRMSRCDS